MAAATNAFIPLISLSLFWGPENRSQPWHNRLLQPLKQALCETCIDAAEHPVRRHRRDRLAEIGGVAQFHGERHTAEEGHAETPGFLLCPAFTENRVMRTAIRADEVRHVLNNAQ